MKLMHALRPRAWQRLALMGGAGVLTFGALAGTGLTTAAVAATQALPAGCSGSSPITCHYGVSPGNYDVTVSIGSSTAAGSTQMWAEARRLMLPTTSTAAGTVLQYSFTINVRQPEAEPTGEGGTGTPGLDLKFTGSAPKVSAITVKAASSPLVAYVAGDSTVCDQPTAPYTGWGQMITSAVGPGAVIANYADSGENSGSFLANSVLYPAIVSKLKAGDLVFIQFGHNDKTTSASDYRSHLTTMVNEARSKGAIPVLVTPMVRHLFNGNTLTPTAMQVNSVGVNLPAEMRAVAASLHVPLIDLTAKSAALVTAMGPDASAALYLRASTDGVSDSTHFSQYGASQMAAFVVQGIRELHLSLVPYLRPTGGNIVAVTNPGSQSGAVGTPISGVQVHATDSSRASLLYSAGGLPAGLSMSPSGLISGTPTVAETAMVTVTALDPSGAWASESFTWTISGSGGGGGGGGGGSSGALHAVGAGKCLDVPNSTQTNGTQVDISDCTGASNQTFTYTAAHELTVYGGAKCLDAYAKGTTAGTKVDIYNCNGGANQQWNINADGSITGVQSGLCLDVTNRSTANGALVELWTCNGGTNQRWTLG